MPEDPPRSRDEAFRYSAEALAEKHGISVEEAKALLSRAKAVPPNENRGTDS